LTKARISAIAILAVVAMSLVARPPISSMGSLLPEVVESLGLSGTQSGIIASTPVFLFGIGAFVSPWLATRFGVNRSLAIVAVVLASALATRVLGGYEALFFGTIGVGVAIAVINVLLPSVVRVEFREHIAAATGLYTALFGVSASVAAAISVPISKSFGGWQFSLGFWALAAFAAFLAWLPLVKSGSAHQATKQLVSPNDRDLVLRSKSGVSIIMFFAAQSAGFYLVLNWLPTILVDYGYTHSEAGNLLGMTTFVGVPIATLSSFFFKRLENLGKLAGIVSLVTVLGYLALILGGNLAIVGCLMIGVGQAVTFPLALTLIATRPSTNAQVTLLSTWAQGAGYLFAAFATFTAGLLRDLTGTWSASLVLILAITVLQVLVGYVAGRSKKINSAVAV